MSSPITNTVVTTGLFGSSYKIHYSKHNGTDYSKFSIMFPGQGINFERIFVEMFKKSSAFRNRVAQADVINTKNSLPLISELISNNELTESNAEKILPIRNILYFVFQVSVFDILRQFSLYPNVICGHSFGEFAGMTSAGLLSFDSAMEMVCFREKILSPNESLGGLVALRIDAEKGIQFAKNNNLRMANINSDNQVVIAFQENEREALKKTLKVSKHSHIFLSKIKQPYHSNILEEKYQIFKKFIIENNFKFQKPNFDYYSFVENKIINSANFHTFDISEVIAGQLIKPVLFKNIILELASLNIFTFIEAGFDSVLNDFIFSIKTDTKLKTITLKDLLTKRKILNSTNKKILEIENSKFAKVVLETIQKVTGYSIEQISIEDSFQENLGIDSIKKAEIIYEILKNTNQNLTGDLSSLSNIKNISDVVAYLETSASSEKTLINEIWEGFKVSSVSIFENYSVKLNSEHHTTAETKVITSPNRSLFTLNQITSKNHLEISDEESFLILKNDLNEANFSLEVTSITKLLISLQDFFKNNESKLKNRNLILQSKNETDPFASILDPFFRSLKMENIFSNFFHINHLNERITPALSSLVTDLQEFNFSNSKIIAIGGSGGIGLSILTNLLSDFTNIELLILGRSQLEQNDSLKNKILELNKLTKTKVNYQCLDAQNATALEKIILDFHKTSNGLDYIFNFTGVEFSRKFLEKDNSEIAKELAAKIVPCLNLKNITKKNNLNCINFHQSSYVSLFGNEGQSIYSLANTIINTLSDKNNRVIAWPAWDKIGMTEKKEVNQRLDFLGVQTIKAKDAFNHFKRDNAKSISFIFNKHDTLLFKLSYLNKYEIGELVKKQSSKYFLRKNIDVNQAESFMKGHIYNDSVAVSMSYLLATISIIGDTFDFKEVTIENFRMKNALVIPFLVDSKRELNIILNHGIDETNHSHESLDIKFFENMLIGESLVKSNKNVSFNVDEYLSEFNSVSKPVPLAFYSKEFASLKTFIFEGLFVPITKLDWFPSNKGLFYGELKLIDNSYNDFYSSKFLRLLQLYEGALQVCSTHNEKLISIPQYIANATIDLNRFKGEIFKVYVKIFKRDEVLFHSKICILNEKNELVIYIDEVVKSIVKLKGA